MPTTENACPHGELMKDFIRPDQVSRCTWKLGQEKPDNCPHTERPFQLRDKILPSILHAIGNTPVIKLNNIPKAEGIKCDMYVKCEFLNPGGSVKDRIGFRMVLDAEERGILKPGCTVIEPTSGNTGIGLAMACAIKGYRCIIVMPEKMSNEKVDTLKALGAEIIRTPTEASFDSPEGLIAVAQKMRKEIPNAIILDQYRNAGNPLAHYDGTADEILWHFDNKIDMIVAGAGTGGTVSGIGRKIKEKCPSCTIVAVDPDQSILARPLSLNQTNSGFYEIEGIGYDFIPTVLDHTVIDEWVKSNDIESFTMARRLIREEGLLCGGSSGSAMASAIKQARRLKEGQKCVVLLPDNIRNYMTKFVSDNWLEARDLKESKNVNNFTWWDDKVSDLHLETPKTLNMNINCEEVIKIMKKENTEYMAVVDEDGNIKGMANLSYILNKILMKKATHKDLISNVLHKTYRKVNLNTKMGRISRILEAEPFVVVTQEQNQYAASDSVKTGELVIGIITRFNLINYITKDDPTNGTTMENLKLN